MKEKWKELKLNYILSSLIEIAGGVVLFIWPGLSLRVACRLLGAVLMIMGLVHLIRFLRAKQGTVIKTVEMVLAVVFAAVGVLICLNPAFVVSIVPIIMGVILIVHGLYDLRQMFYMGKAKYRYWWVAFLLAMLTVGGGAVLIWNPFETMEFAIKVIGIFMVYDGISDLWIVTETRRAQKDYAMALELKEVKDAAEEYKAAADDRKAEAMLKEEEKLLAEEVQKAEE